MPNQTATLVPKIYITVNQILILNFLVYEVSNCKIVVQAMSNILTLIPFCHFQIVALESFQMQ